MNAIRNLPIGVQSFEILRTEGYLYVDKTDLMYKLVTEGRQYFLSRPRRFGKSLLITTLRAYFGGKKDLFKGLAIEKLETKWKKYPVFYLDFSRTGDSYADVEARFTVWMGELDKQYKCRTSRYPNLAERFGALVKKVFRKQGPIVFLVDEYDKPLLGAKGEDLERIRSLFKAIFGNLKGLDEYFRFAWLAGITKFAKVSIFSDLNRLNVISMNKTYATLCGITQAELEANFAPEIDAMMAEQGLIREACLDNLRKMYDGYRFHPDGKRVYNPFSLMKAFGEERFGAYWFDSATSSSLITALQKNVDKLRELPAQDKITVSAATLTSAYEDNNNPLTCLFQAGYLTIIRYDSEYLEYTLDYPNDEVRYGFLNVLIPYVTDTAFADRDALEITRMSRDFEDGNTASVMARLQSHLAKLPYQEGPDAAMEGVDRLP